MGRPVLPHPVTYGKMCLGTHARGAAGKTLYSGLDVVSDVGSRAFPPFMVGSGRRQTVLQRKGSALMLEASLLDDSPSGVLFLPNLLGCHEALVILNRFDKAVAGLGLQVLDEVRRAARLRHNKSRGLLRFL
mgnify:CR=1 FL=1